MYILSQPNIFVTNKYRRCFAYFDFFLSVDSFRKWLRRTFQLIARMSKLFAILLIMLKFLFLQKSNFEFNSRNYLFWILKKQNNNAFNTQNKQLIVIFQYQISVRVTQWWFNKIIFRSVFIFLDNRLQQNHSFRVDFN